MRTKAELKKYLKKRFGITTRAQLDALLKKCRIDITPFVSSLGEEDEDAHEGTEKSRDSREQNH